jgi:hypothetical protein
MSLLAYTDYTEGPRQPARDVAMVIIALERKIGY